MNKIFRQDRCPLAPKVKSKLLFLNLEKEGNHEFELLYITKFMKSSIDYVVYGECKHCGKEVNRHFVTHEELIRYGYKKEFLKSITDNIVSLKNGNGLRDDIIRDKER